MANTNFFEEYQAMSLKSMNLGLKAVSANAFFEQANQDGKLVEFLETYNDGKVFLNSMRELGTFLQNYSKTGG